MKPRHTQSLDANHTEIVRYLRSHGVEVTDFAGAGKVPDLMVYWKGVARWAEVKVPTRKAAFKYLQLKFIAIETTMPVAFVTTKEAALDYAKTGRGELTTMQRHRIAVMLQTDKKDAYTVGQIERCLG